MKTKENKKALEQEEWYTPKSLVDALLKSGDELFGTGVGNENFLFDLDPASSKDKNVIKLSKRIFTREDNGLLQTWSENEYVFLNPPFTNGRDSKSPLKQFANKIVKHNNGIVLCLEKPNVSVTGLMRANCSCMVLFRRRLTYRKPTWAKRTEDNPKYYSLMYGFGEKALIHLTKFCEIYSEKGMEPEIFYHKL